MASFEPLPPYSQQELDTLYPSHLQLELVQVLLRHGERTPVSPRFQNAGLRPYWPYCGVARQMTSMVLSQPDLSEWDGLKWKRRLETFGSNDGAIVAAGPRGEVDDICLPGELTDKGRETTLALGRRLRHLYVDQLGFMPKLIANSDLIYLRATPIPRALESVQQAFSGFYPRSARTADFPPVTILTRSLADETLFPNESGCKRFRQLARAFAQLAADRWNDTDEMAYLNKLMSKWMPENSPKIAIDSHPRLSGIVDTTNATLAHGPETRLPKEFYDTKARDLMDKIIVDEWFRGYSESEEYRAVGIGGLMGDIVSRMVGSVESNGKNRVAEIGGETNVKLALAGCHDTTLAGALHSLGAFGNEKWPPFTSYIAFELFQGKDGTRPSVGELATQHAVQNAATKTSYLPTEKGWWSKLFGSKSNAAPEIISRRRIEELSDIERRNMDGYYVRLRYNDKVIQVPGCAAVGKHLDGDESFCTLEAFKSIVDKYTPRDWKVACESNLDKPAFPTEVQPAGF